MGGKGSGGRRRNAGRPRKSADEHFVTGDAGRRGRVLEHPSAPKVPAVPVVEEFDAPDDLTFDERVVWLKLAPHAFKNGTLTRASELAFSTLCRNVVDMQKARDMERGGTAHRGLIQKVEAGLDAFQLRPTGKPMPVAEPAKAEPKAAGAYW